MKKCIIASLLIAAAPVILAHDAERLYHSDTKGRPLLIDSCREIGEQRAITLLQSDYWRRNEEPLWEIQTSRLASRAAL